VTAVLPLRNKRNEKDVWGKTKEQKFSTAFFEIHQS
jgi:hypothetical protein